ncbi:unnamed protein product [Amoebophrya sp. A120]|nr:unnamed protein product [Amoebophrya sp. A120]|eukprot:GSA120T00011472001.1
MGGGNNNRGNNKGGGGGQHGKNSGSSSKNNNQRNKKKADDQTTRPVAFDKRNSSSALENDPDTNSKLQPIECPVCCDTAVCAAIGVECGHWACFKCQLRIRDLAQSKETKRKCPMCKTTNNKLVFTQRPDYFLQNIKNDNTNRFYTEVCHIKFDEWGHGFDKENKALMQRAVEDLYLYKCWTCAPPQPAFQTLWDLTKHMEKQHSRYFCRTCLDGREIFLEEQMCYATKDELDLHHRVGDSGLVPIKPHADCQFCKKSFFTHQELYQHMIVEHITCFLCFEAHRENRFFKDMTCLFNHFLAEHHVCRYERCMREGIFSQETVFAHEAQLAQHRIAVHKNHNGPTKEECYRPKLDITVTSTLNGLSHAQINDKETMAAMPQQDKPIYFTHIHNPERPPKEVILPPLPKKEVVDRYPDLGYGMSWKDFDAAKHRKKAQERKKKTATTGGGVHQNGAPGSPEQHVYDPNAPEDGKEQEGNVKNGASTPEQHPVDSGDAGSPAEDSEDDQRTFLRANEYEAEQQQKMVKALPADLLDLPPSVRMDTQLQKSSFLHAIDAVLECSVGSVTKCKVELMKESVKQQADGGAAGRVDIPGMKKHIAMLSPLALDSLSEMRAFLLQTWDSRFNTELITGLRPLFFRTLRNEDHKGTPAHWLTWKYQAHNALGKLRANERELIRLYVGFCLERNVTSYAGLDRAKEYPSLEQSAVSAAAKDADAFNPELAFRPERRGVAGTQWQGRNGGFNAMGSQDFPALAETRTVDEDGTPLLELTMAEKLKLQEQKEKMKKTAKAPSTASKLGGKKPQLDNEAEFPSFPIGLQPLGGGGPPPVKKPVTKSSVFGAASLSAGGASSSAASSSSTPNNAVAAKKKAKVGQPSAAKDITLNSNPNAPAPPPIGQQQQSSSSSSSSRPRDASTGSSSLLKGIQEKQELLKTAYGPTKIKDEAAERGQVAKKLGNAENFPALPSSSVHQPAGKSRDTGGLLKGANIISKKTGTVVPVQQGSKTAQLQKKKDLFDDDDDFADVSFAQALVTQSGSADAEPGSPSWNSKRPVTTASKVPDAWDDDELFPTLNEKQAPPPAGDVSPSKPLVGKAKQLEEQRLRQEARDARLAKQLQDAENNSAGKTEQAPPKARGRQKKTLIAWG